MSDREPDIYDARSIEGEVCPILPTAIDPNAFQVCRRLHEAGHRVYLVGGCVRDLLLGGTPKDFDVATSARPRQVKKLFRNARIIGRRFRLVHVLFGRDKQIEVSTFRRDPNGDGGDGGEVADAGAGDAVAREELPSGEERGDALSDVLGEESPRDERELGEDGDRDLGNGDDSDRDGGDEDLLIREDNVYGSEAEDAVRRDFTINGLFYDVQRGQVIDYVGGVPDLRRRVLRTIGDASRRLREDPVRILRAVKFATRLKLGLDPRLASAMADHHEELVKSAPARVFEEILRVVGGLDPDKSIEVLAGLGALRVLFPELGLPAQAAEDDPRLQRLLARLRVVGRIDRGRRSLPTAIYLAAIFFDRLLESAGVGSEPREGPPIPGESIDRFLRPLGQRCRMAKRDTARIRAAMLTLRRIDPLLADANAKKRRRRGGIGDLMRRECFDDALLLMRIAWESEGRDLAPVFEWEQKRDELLGPRHDRRDEPMHEPELPRRDDARAAPQAGARPGTPPPARPAHLRHDDEPPRSDVSGDAVSAEGPHGRRRRRRRRRRGGDGSAVSGFPASAPFGADEAIADDDLEPA